MDYNKLLEQLNLYGISEEDIIKRRGTENILEDVVVAPWWENTMFSKYCNKIEQISDKVFNVYGDDFAFSFIEIRNMGASALMEEVLALGVTKVKRIVFVGSAGAINTDIKVGDIVVPLYSYNGVGATRYLNENLSDDFEMKYYPSELLSKGLLESANRICDNVYNVANYSVDTIISQFPHIQHIISLQASTVEMETSCLFRCAEIMGIEAGALFVISDNTVLNKSLYSGRKQEDKEKKKKAKSVYIPEIVIDFFKKNKSIL